MKNTNRTLFDTFGNRCEDFIKYVFSLNKDIIRIFKEQYGENLDGYNDNAKLTPKEKNIIKMTKTRYKRKYIFNDDIEKDSTKISHFKDQVLRVYGMSLEEIFIGNMETITYLLNYELKNTINKKTTQEMIETLKGILKGIKANRDRFSENQTLYSELIKYGFNNDKLNTYVYNRLSSQSQLLISLKYGSSLNALNTMNIIENRRILYNVILPLLFSRLESAYKKFEEKTLQSILGKNYNDFINCFLKTLPISIQTIFQELFGKKYDTYIFDNHLNKEKFNIINSTIKDYFKQMKTNTNTEEPVIKLEVPEDSSEQIEIKDTKNKPDLSSETITMSESENHSSTIQNNDRTESKQLNNERIGINSSFTLHLVDEMGNASYRDFTIVDMETLNKQSKFEKILCYDSNARRILGKSEGDTVLFIKSEIKYDATIFKIYGKRENNSRSISMEKISKYADSEYLSKDITKSKKN